LPYSLSVRELGARDEVERKAGEVADLVLNVERGFDRGLM
jgi:hypothetical protein